MTLRSPGAATLMFSTFKLMTGAGSGMGSGSSGNWRKSSVSRAQLWRAERNGFECAIDNSTG